MYTGMPRDLQPYVLACDRESDVKTVWWIRPEPPKQSRVYRLRLDAALENCGDDPKAKADIEHDYLTERLLNVLEKLTNAHKPGDCIVKKGELKKILDNLDNYSRQEIALSACAWAQLKSGLVKNLKCSPSTSKGEQGTEGTGSSTPAGAAGEKAMTALKDA